MTTSHNIFFGLSFTLSQAADELKAKEAETKALKEAEAKAEKAKDGKFRFEQLSSCVFVFM